MALVFSCLLFVCVFNHIIYLFLPKNITGTCFISFYRHLLTRRLTWQTSCIEVCTTYALKIYSKKTKNLLNGERATELTRETTQ